MINPDGLHYIGLPGWVIPSASNSFFHTIQNQSAYMLWVCKMNMALLFCRTCIRNQNVYKLWVWEITRDSLRCIVLLIQTTLSTSKLFFHFILNHNASKLWMNKMHIEKLCWIKWMQKFATQSWSGCQVRVWSVEVTITVPFKQPKKSTKIGGWQRFLTRFASRNIQKSNYQSICIWWVESHFVDRERDHEIMKWGPWRKQLLFGEKCGKHLAKSVMGAVVRPRSHWTSTILSLGWIEERVTFDEGLLDVTIWKIRCSFHRVNITSKYFPSTSSHLFLRECDRE